MYKIEQSPEQASDQEPQRQDRIYYGWVIVLVCLLVMTLIAPMLASFSIFYVAILEDMKWSRHTAGNNGNRANLQEQATSWHVLLLLRPDRLGDVRLAVAS